MASKLAAVALGIVLALVGASSASALEPKGVTVTPAALTLDLPENQSQVSTSFAVTNHYDTAVVLAFQFEASSSASSLLFIESSLLSLEPGETKQQQISLQDSVALSPGSQNATLLVSQQLEAGVGVGVASSIRLPVTLIKQAGAVSNFNVLGVTTPGFSMSIPETVTVALKNTGNMTIIPRGVVQVTDPNGRLVAQGALNSSSLGLSPGDDFTLETPLISLASATLPGPYRITVQYGLGGGQASEQSATTMWYVAWWQVVVMLAFGLGAYYALRSLLLNLHRRRIVQRPRPKRALLLGRDIT